MNTFLLLKFSLSRKSRSDVVSVIKLVSNRVEKHSPGQYILNSVATVIPCILYGCKLCYIKEYLGAM